MEISNPCAGILVYSYFLNFSSLSGFGFHMFVLGCISSLPQLAWDKRLCCWINVWTIDLSNQISVYMAVCIVFCSLPFVHFWLCVCAVFWKEDIFLNLQLSLSDGYLIHLYSTWWDWGGRNSVSQSEMNLLIWRSICCQRLLIPVRSGLWRVKLLH